MVSNRTGSSVLLVAIIHVSFDAAINQLSRDVVPASNTTRFLIFSAVIIVFAAAVIIATKGRLGRPADVVPAHEAGDAAGEHLPDGTAERETDPRDARSTGWVKESRFQREDKPPPSPCADR